MPEPAFLTHEEVATLLCSSPDWLYRNRPKLVKAGFPDRDPLVRKYLRADVEAWINKRRRVKDEATQPTAPGINFDAF